MPETTEFPATLPFVKPDRTVVCIAPESTAMRFLENAKSAVQLERERWNRAAEIVICPRHHAYHVVPVVPAEDAVSPS